MSKFKGLEGKVGIVTGGGAGIGEQSSLLLAENGVKVVVADLNEESGRLVAQKIKDSGGEAEFIKTDVTDEKQVDDMVDFAVDTFGGLDLAHNNAGIAQQPLPFHEVDLNVWEKQVAINQRSVMLCLRSELRYMSGNGGGAIVNASSLSGLLASPGTGPYSMVKHAVNGLTRVAAVDYGKQNIRVNAVAPGVVPTGFYTGTPPEQVREWAAHMTMGRSAEPEEIAQAVAFLLSDAASYINGVVLPVDGGSHIEL